MAASERTLLRHTTIGFLSPLPEVTNTTHIWVSPLERKTSYSHILHFLAGRKITNWEKHRLKPTSSQQNKIRKTGKGSHMQLERKGDLFSVSRSGGSLNWARFSVGRH